MLVNKSVNSLPSYNDVLKRNFECSTLNKNKIEITENYLKDSEKEKDVKITGISLKDSEKKIDAKIIAKKKKRKIITIVIILLGIAVFYKLIK